MRKEIGWHDDRNNSSGVITATLASDVQLLNGASSEGAAAILEASASLLWGITLSFVFSWPMGLVGLGTAPFFVVGSFIQQKAENDMFFEGAANASAGNDKKE